MKRDDEKVLAAMWLGTEVLKMFIVYIWISEEVILFFCFLSLPPFFRVGGEKELMRKFVVPTHCISLHKLHPVSFSKGA
jgi:hypothetical protein